MSYIKCIYTIKICLINNIMENSYNKKLRFCLDYIIQIKFN